MKKRSFWVSVAMVGVFVVLGVLLLSGCDGNLGAQSKINAAHRLDTTRVELKCNVRYEEEDQGDEWNREEIVAGKTEKRTKSCYLFDSYSRFCNVREKEELPLKEDYFDERDFKNKSYIVVFTIGKEYCRYLVSGLSREGGKAVVNVSKPRNNTIGETFLRRVKEDSGLDVSEAIEQLRKPFGGNNAFVYVIEVDKKDVWFVDQIEVSVQGSDQLYYYQDALESGIITEEDVNSMTYYCLYADQLYKNPDETPNVEVDYEVLPKVPAEIDEETKQKFLMTVRGYLLAWLKYDPLKFTRNLEVVYLGTYNGYIAATFSAEMNIGGIVHASGVSPEFFLWKAE